MPWNIFKQILFCTSQIWESQALSIGEKMGAGKSLISVLWLLVAKRLYGTARALGTWGVKNLEDCKRSVWHSWDLVMYGIVVVDNNG